jgi:uncharacterized protein (DUF2235 family)
VLLPYNITQYLYACARSLSKTSALSGSFFFEQISYYSVGVGTAFGKRLRGAMFGYGLNDEIIRAYEWLIDHYNVGDELFIFGFMTIVLGASARMASMIRPMLSSSSISESE